SVFQPRRRPLSPPVLRVLTRTQADEAPPSPRVEPARRRSALMPLLPVAYRGSYLRRLLAPRRPVERALLSVIQETYLSGASTRTVDVLAETVGVPGSDPAIVAAQAQEWDERVEAFRRRPLLDPSPYLMLAVTPALGREHREALAVHLAIAVAISDSGSREVIGFEVATAERMASFWAPFFRDLRDRGLQGLQLVTSDQ